MSCNPKNSTTCKDYLSKKGFNDRLLNIHGIPQCNELKILTTFARSSSKRIIIKR